MKYYTETDAKLHWLCQIVSKANRTFISKKEDDSHTNLYFDSLGKYITGRWIGTQDARLLFMLNLENLNIEIKNDLGQLLSSVPTLGSTMQKVEERIELLLPNLGLNPKGFRAELHYTIPDYSFTKETIQAIPEKSLEEWIRIRRMANEACVLLLGHAQSEGEIRIWPHHFDTGIYTKINSKISLGFGLAMQDAMAGSPYFYMSGYPAQGKLEYNHLPSNGPWKWQTKTDWQGAYLPLTEFDSKTIKDQESLLHLFLSSVFNWYSAY